MRLRFLAGIALAIGTTACLDTLEPPKGRLGVIEMPTYESGPDYVVSPVATFFRRTDGRFRTTTNDTCYIAPFFAQPQTVDGETMDVGDEISLVFTDRVASLLPVSEYGYTYYTRGALTGIPITTGDSVEAVIPGRAGSYPSFNIKVRTAEAFEHAPIGVPGDGEDLELTWDPAPEPGAYMVFSLRYSVAPSAGIINQQIRCGLVDDGSHTVSWGLLSGWRNSLLDTRETLVTRLRYTETMVDNRSQLVFISTFARPLSSPP